MNTLVSAEYEKLWSAPDLQARIDEGIRLHRQSDAVIRVVNYSGKPLPGVKIRVRQHDSPFNFGANIFKLGDYSSPALNRGYEEAFCGLFNRATVPFYWRTLEPEQGRPRFAEHSVPIVRRPPPDRVVKFCRERGLRMHGHTLVWNVRKWSVPDWLPPGPEAAAPFWEKRIREIAERYGSCIGSWDVVNEAVSGRSPRPSGPIPMCENYENQSFAWAEKYLPPAARLDINETTGFSWNPDKPDYGRLIEELLAAKRKVGGIGLQFHAFSDESLLRVLSGELHAPDALIRMLDRHEEFNLPLHISEITLTAPGNTPEGLESQAVVARNFYRLFFSQKSSEGITWWNVPDGGAAPGEDKVFSGLLFADMTPKPAYAALHRLIHEEWRTRTEGVSDADGVFRFRGFHGSYVIQIETENKDSGLQSAITLESGKTAAQTIHLL